MDDIHEQMLQKKVLELICPQFWLLAQFHDFHLLKLQCFALVLVYLNQYLN